MNKTQIDQVSNRTVRREMNRIGFNYITVFQDISLTKQQKKLRYDLARSWLASKHPWQITIFSDEKKFNLDGPDCWASWADPGHSLFRQKRQQGGRGLMVWAMLLPNFVVHLDRIDGNQNAEKYVDLLKRVKTLLDEDFGENGYYFQHDNASIHTANLVKHFLAESKMQTIAWPVKSPDLNLVENVWSCLCHIVYANRQYDSVEELWQALEDASDVLTFERDDILKNLYNDMNNRLVEVIECKGDKIKR